jgi:hypothetical protein
MVAANLQVGQGIRQYKQLSQLQKLLRADNGPSTCAGTGQTAEPVAEATTC